MFIHLQYRGPELAGGFSAELQKNVLLEKSAAGPKFEANMHVYRVAAYQLSSEYQSILVRDNPEESRNRKCCEITENLIA